MSGVEWMDRAICASIGSEIFFPVERDETESTAGHQPRVYLSAREAKKVCAMCPVAAECVEFALTNRIEHGIWGGYTGGELARMTPRGTARVQV